MFHAIWNLLRFRDVFLTSDMYLRRASGLTRKISPMDALIFSTIAPGPVTAYMYVLWCPGLYPGVDMFWGCLALLLFLPIMGLYYLFSISMPRSGGEYVYVSRTLHPAAGLFANWALTVAGLSWTGTISAWEVQYGFGPLFWNAGALNGDKGLMALGVNLQTPTWLGGVLLGLVVLAFAEFVLWRGAKFSMRVFMIGMVFSLISLATIVIASSSSTPAYFIQRVQQLNPGVDFQRDIIQAAVNMNVGWTPNKFILSATLFGSTAFMMLNMVGNTYTTNIAGEIKNVGKAQPLALFGSVTFFVAWWFILTGVVYTNPGANFTSAISILSDAGVNPLVMTAWPHQEVIYMTTNSTLVNLSDIGFLVGNFTCLTALSLGPIRNIFAWSFDRLLPEMFAKVDKRGSPFGACALAAVISLIMYLLYIYTTYLVYILFTVTLWFCAWVVVGIAGICFPYLKRTKDIYDKSPSQVKTKIFGVPIICVLGVITALISTWVVYALRSQALPA